MTLYFLPAAAAESGSAPGGSQSEGGTPGYAGGVGKFRPASLGFGVGLGRSTGFNWDLRWIAKPWAAGAFQWMCDSDRAYYGGHTYHDTGSARNAYGTFASYHANALTSSLNHEDHGSPCGGDPLRGPDGGFNALRGHEWTHVTVSWKIPYQAGHAQPGDLRIVVNGNLASSAGIPTPAYNEGYGDGGHAIKSQVPWWWISPVLWNIGGTAPWWQNTIVSLGGETDWPINQYGVDYSGTRNVKPILAGGTVPRNFQADATYDEFFLWTDRGTAPGEGMYGAQKLWARGRYYRPADSNPADAIFTSAPILLPPGALLSRRLAPPGGAVPPGAGSMIAIPPLSAPPARVVGVSWTAHGEAVNPSTYPTHPAAVGRVMIPYVRDWSVPPAAGGPATVALAAAPDANGFRAVSLADLYVTNTTTGVTQGPLRNEHFSPLSLPVAPGEEIAYRAKLRLGPIDALNAILLSSPVLDDVTLYYAREGSPVRSIGWERSFP